MAEKPDPPGWYLDKDDPTLIRWFDGNQWTSKTRTVLDSDQTPPGQPAADPAPTHASKPVVRTAQQQPQRQSNSQFAGFVGVGILVIGVAVVAVIAANSGSQVDDSPPSLPTPPWTANSDTYATRPPQAPTSSPTDLANDERHGIGAEAFARTALNLPGPADDSLEPVVITMTNTEDDVLAVPGLREGVEIAVEQINRELGGINGRPVELRTCIHGVSDSTTLCPNEVVAIDPTINIVGLEVFSQIASAALDREGVPSLQTSPVLIDDGTEPSPVSMFGGCSLLQQGAALLMVDELQADRVAVVYQTDRLLEECYGDAMERTMLHLAQQRQSFAWQGFGYAPDQDAQVANDVGAFLRTADRPVVFVVTNDDACVPSLQALREAAPEAQIVADTRCFSDSVTSQPGSAGMIFALERYVPVWRNLYESYVDWELEWVQDSFSRSPITLRNPGPPTEVGHAAGLLVWQVLSRADAQGINIDDSEAVQDLFRNLENQHVVGAPPMTCVNTVPEFSSLCADTVTFLQWTGQRLEQYPAKGFSLRVNDLRAGVAETHPR